MPLGQASKREEGDRSPAITGPRDTSVRYRKDDEVEELTLGRVRQSPKEVTGSRTARACRHSRTNGMKT